MDKDLLAKGRIAAPDRSRIRLDLGARVAEGECLTPAARLKGRQELHQRGRRIGRQRQQVDLARAPAGDSDHLGRREIAGGHRRRVRQRRRKRGVLNVCAGRIAGLGSVGAHLAQAGEHHAHLIAARLAGEHMQLVEHHTGHVHERARLFRQQRVERFGRRQQQVGGALRVEAIQVARLDRQPHAQAIQRRVQPVGDVGDQRAGGQQIEQRQPGFAARGRQVAFDERRQRGFGLAAGRGRAEHHVGAVEQRRDGGELGRSESAVAGEEGRPGAREAGFEEVRGRIGADRVVHAGSELRYR